MSSVNFTNPYYESDNLYIKRRNDTALKSKESLKGKKLGVLQGSEQEMIASSVDGVDIVSFKNISGAIMELNKRNLDAILVDEAVGKHYISKSQNLEEFLKESYINIGFAFAVSKQSDPELLNSLNLALDEMMLDGTYELILEKYGLKDKM